MAFHRPKNDPFFEDLCADIQAGLAELDRGEGLDEEVVWAELERRISAVEQQNFKHSA